VTWAEWFFLAVGPVHRAENHGNPLPAQAKLMKFTIPDFHVAWG
jgi:hypothetical protein